MPYRFITIDAEDGEAQFQCLGCWWVQSIAIMQAMTNAGLITPGAENAPPG